MMTKPDYLTTAHTQACPLLGGVSMNNGLCSGNGFLALHVTVSKVRRDLDHISSSVSTMPGAPIAPAGWGVHLKHHGFH